MSRIPTAFYAMGRFGRVAGVLTLTLVASAGNGNAQAIHSEKKLGQALFSDRNLSLDRSVACASCHQPEHAFADIHPVSVGVRAQKGTRNVPSLLDIDEYTFFFWDGRALTLEQQAQVPFLTANEMGFSNTAQVVERVRENPRYFRAIQAMHADAHHTLGFSDVVRALMAYERSIGTFPNSLDLYIAGDHAALSPSAVRGLEIFRGKAGCATCHAISATSAPLTDNAFHQSGIGLVAISPNLAKLAAAMARLPQGERFRNIESNSSLAALGRYIVTLNPQDIGKFRTPSLRNVAVTAPYMHNGSIATLDEAIDAELYYRGLKLGHPIVLSARERSDLRAFLNSLSSPTAQPARSSLIGIGRYIPTYPGPEETGRSPWNF